MPKIILEELILEMMPFSPELVAWCKNHPEFFAAIKNIYPKKFISPGMIMTSTSPNYPNDQVIGVYTYDYNRGKPIFKQDFIVNKGKSNTEFILYTRNPSGSSKYVKDINEFYEKYGKDGYHKYTHHLNLEELPLELQERAKETIALSEKVKGYDLDKIPQAHIERIYAEAIKEKEGAWLVKQKMQNQWIVSDSNSIEAKNSDGQK